MTLSAGTRLGRYEIRHSLGAGGMGEVYLAWDHELEREVALKVLHAGREDDSDRVRRFIQEAKAASALNHPNVTQVYDVGSESGLRFITMEVVEGETLRRRLARGPLSIEEVLTLGSQIASALAAAHKAGIIHRDVKPENVIIHRDGYAKVLDFGLAKFAPDETIRTDQNADTVLRTRSGIVVGTLRYMAPEQLSGDEVTPAADVFSLGVVLFEMLVGRSPFQGNTPAEVAAAILTQPAPSSLTLREATPPGLSALIAKALAKDPLARFANSGELLEELRDVSRESHATAVDIERHRIAEPLRKRRLVIAGAVVLLAVLLAGAWMMLRAQRVRRANDSLTTAEKLLGERKLAEAYAAVADVEKVLPGDRRLQAIVASATTRATIDSEPAGATVYLQRFHGPAQRAAAGVTPLVVERLPRADYVLTFEKEGFAPATRLLSIAPAMLFNTETPREPPTARARLLPANEVPPGMLLVEGGEYRLTGWSRPSDRTVVLDDFFVDRYEVSNREFEEFVRAGGYRNRAHWQQPLVRDGHALEWSEAMALFVDKTGLPGPRDWVGGAPPPGREQHPVTHVTWHEAAAFAHWRGKSLPTVYQWEKAARYPMRGAVGTAFPWGVVKEGMDVTERANFSGQGTLPVDALPFGVSPWGAYQMAGNVAEWCLNAFAPGHAARGGGWNDAVYSFGRTAAFPAFYTSEQVGFRCVKGLKDAPRDQGAFALNPEQIVPDYKPVDDATFATIRTRYDYEHAPLEVRLVESVDAPAWRREKLEYVVGEKKVLAYLYLPKGFQGPLQVIHFAPAGDVVSGNRTLPSAIENQLAPYLRGGRAIFSVVMEGFLERPAPSGAAIPDSRSPEYVDYVVAQVTELRRGLDLLETRKELDLTRVAFLGPSAGSWAGVILTALEARYRSVLFIGTDIEPSEVTDAPAANRINFAPRIAAPKMMLQGRYDEAAPLATEAEPLFRLLREPRRLEVFEGSHVPPAEVSVPIISKWFDETLGPVAR